MDSLNYLFGGIGLIVFAAAAIFAVLSVLVRVWLYLINIYTRQTRTELRKLNEKNDYLVTHLEEKGPRDF